MWLCQAYSTISLSKSQQREWRAEEGEGSYDKLRVLRGPMPYKKTKITHLTFFYFFSHLQNVITNLSSADKNEVPLQTLLHGNVIVILITHKVSFCVFLFFFPSFCPGATKSRVCASHIKADRSCSLEGKGTVRISTSSSPSRQQGSRESSAVTAGLGWWNGKGQSLNRVKGPNKFILRKSL